MTVIFKHFLLSTIIVFLYSCNLPITSGSGSFEFNGNVNNESNTQTPQQGNDPALAPALSEPSPWGQVNANVGNVVLSIKTDKASICRYDSNDRAYNSLGLALQPDNTGKTHTALAMVSPQSFYKYFVKCRSMNSGDENVISKTIEFSTMGNADIAPPMLSAAQPAGVLPSATKTALLSIKSNEKSQCRYDAANKSYVTMNSMLSTTDGLTHSKMINVASGTGYVYFVQCSDEAGNITSTPSLIQFFVDKAGVVDTIGPVLSSLMPAGSLDAGTKQATLSLISNEAADCRYSKSSQASYAQMSAMQMTGGLNHYTQETGLADAMSYQYFVQCQDKAKNLSQKGVISFNVKQVVAFNALAYHEMNCAGCHGAAANSRKKNATAQDIQDGIDGNKGGMGKFSSLTPAQVAAIAVVLQDVQPAAAPVLSGLAPGGSLPENTANVTLAVKTNIDSECRYDLTDLPFQSLNNRFGADGTGTSHTAMYPLQANKTEYRLYVRCQSKAGGVNMMSSLIVFDTKIKVDTEAPMISSPMPSGTIPATSTTAQLRVTTNEKAECKYDTSSKMYSLMAFELDFDNAKVQHSKTIAVKEDTPYSFFVSCSDEKGNITIANTEIKFRVDKQEAKDIIAPLMSGFMPGGELNQGTKQTLISLNTNEAANCRYSANGSATYAQMTTFMTTGAQSHSSNVAGLEDGKQYDFYVRCQDASGNTSAQGKIAFSVKAPAAINGVALYNTNCASCHGVNVAQSQLKGRAANTGVEYQAGINRINAMSFLRGKLSIAQLDAIAAVVNQVSAPAPVSTIDNAQIVVGTRRSIASKFMVIFSSGNDTAKTRIENRITKESNGFLGGACTPYEDTVDCPGSSEESRVNASMLPNISSIRRSLVYSTCGEVIREDSAANTALSRAGLNANSAGNESNVRKLADLFFPGVVLSTEAARGLASVHQEAKTKGLDNTDSWKMVMQPMCQSSLFESY